MEGANGQVRSFSDSVLRFLERVEHRIATSPTDRDAVFRLRYDAYQKGGFLKSGADAKLDAQLYDPLFDDDPNGWTTMTFVDGELAGTIRTNLGSGRRAVLPGLQVFDDVLIPRLGAGQVVVDFTRFAAKLELSSAYPQLVYAIMRPAYMAAKHYDADYAVACPRAEHIAFYRRAFGAVMWCPPRDYPRLAAKVACMGVEFRNAQDRIEARYPFYKSTAAEREALFGFSKRLVDRIGIGPEATIPSEAENTGAELTRCA
jgi:hypothetical protein